MKTIKLKVYKEDIGGRDTFLTTYDLLMSAVRNTNPQQGITVDEMAKRMRLLTEIDKHKPMFNIKPEDFKDSCLELEADLELEDADYSKLKELFKEMKWGVVSSSIVEISESLK